jgi:hypothetical protein
LSDGLSGQLAKHRHYTQNAALPHKACNGLITEVILYATVELARIGVGGGTLTLKKPDILQVCQAGSSLLCACLAWQINSGYGGTEFSGGWLTGRLLSMQDIGTVLFIVAIVLTFVFPRVAAAIGFAASVLCLPLYFFFIAPVPFAQVFARGHEFKVEPVPGFHWDIWPAAGLCALAVTLYFCIRCLATTGRKQIPQRA